MRDRGRDLLAALLLLALAGAVPDLTVAGGWAAGALAALLLASLAGARRAGDAGRLPRVALLAGMLFLAAQPYAVPGAESGPLPVRALVLLGVSLVLWVHMNVQSVSGKLAWSFSRVDFAVIGAAGCVIAGSLGLLWMRPESPLTPQILLQGMAITLVVVYLFGSRWRPGRAAFLSATLVLAGVLGAGFTLALARDAALARDLETLVRTWQDAAPLPGDVEAVVQRARRTRRGLAPRILSRAALAAVDGGRPETARSWAERAVGGAGDLPHGWLALSAAALATGDELEAEAARGKALRHLAGPGGPPGDLGPIPPPLARGVAVDLLDRGRPGAALLWLDASGPAGRYDLLLLRAESLLQAGRAAEAREIEAALAASHPDRPEPRLGLARARLLLGDREGAARALQEAAAAGAPEPLLWPLAAELAGGDDPGGEEARRRLAAGIELVARDDWPDWHPNGNFLYADNEDRRVPLLLVPGRRYVLRIEARGEAAGGAAPRMAVEMEGRTLATFDVPSPDWEWFAVDLIPSGPAAAVRLIFPNDYSIPGGEDRNLVVGTVVLAAAGKG